MNRLKLKRIATCALSMLLALITAFGFMTICHADKVYAANESITVNFKTLDENGNEVDDPETGGILEYRGDKIENGVPFNVYGTDTRVFIYHTLTEGYKLTYKVEGTYDNDYDADGAITISGITSDIIVNVTFKKDIILDPINVNVPKLKAGTKIEVTENDGKYAQTPTPGITADTGYEIYESDFWSITWQGYFKYKTEDHSSFTPDNLFTGTVAEDSDIWARVAIQPTSGYDFNIDWYDYHYFGDVAVNGQESDESAAFVVSGSLIIMAKVPIEPADEPEPTPTPTPTPTPAVNNSSFLLAQMTAKGSKALNISWTKVNGAAGYDIFLSKCNKGKEVYKPQKVKTITGAANTKWTKKGLKKKTAYKAYVKAYVMKDGQKTYVASSPIIHAFTSNGNKYYTNAKSVTVKKSKVSLKAGKTFKIKASVKKAKSGKKLISKGHAAKLRYISSNVKVAKVNGAGNITAVAKGTCKVYAYTPNGVKKAVKVTVK